MFHDLLRTVQDSLGGFGGSWDVLTILDQAQGIHEEVLEGV